MVLDSHMCTFKIETHDSNVLDILSQKLLFCLYTDNEMNQWVMLKWM